MSLLCTKVCIRVSCLHATALYFRTDDDIRRFAVVQESADKLLRTGNNTIQKTSLLRKAVEMEQIDEELERKREEFRERMAQNKLKEETLRRRQEKIKERVNKFDRFLKDNDAKRVRALRKYQLEVKENKRRAAELQELKAELERVRDHKEAVLRKLASHRKYEEYMMRVIDALPENYVEMSGENVILSVIQRYEGLSATHAKLIEKNATISGDTERDTKILENMKQEQAKQKLVINSEIAGLQDYLESLTQRIQYLMQEASDSASSHRSMAGELGRITMAIDNLSELCHAPHWPPLAEMSHLDKLCMIGQHFNEQVRVSKLLHKWGETRHSVTSSVKPLPKIPEKVRTKEPVSKTPSYSTIDSSVKRRGKLATAGFTEHLKTISESLTE